MLNISLCFNRKDFEYDVYSLIKAFYPGCEITSLYEEIGRASCRERVYVLV